MNNQTEVKIIDIGLGNIASIQNMLKKIGFDSERMTEPIISENKPDLLILPGVGSYDYAMKKLNDGGWVEFIQKIASEKSTPIMGICLGMQLLCEGSEEGKLDGLSLIPGHFRKFQKNEDQPKLKVPHMGWNEVHFQNSAEWMSRGYEKTPRYYFVHSYYYTHDTSDYVAGETHYGVTYASAIQNGNVFGFQFHPEKSHKFGMNLFRNVMEKIC